MTPSMARWLAPETLVQTGGSAVLSPRLRLVGAPLEEPKEPEAYTRDGIMRATPRARSPRARAKGPNPNKLHGNRRCCIALIEAKQRQLPQLHLPHDFECTACRAKFAIGYEFEAAR